MNDDFDDLDTALFALPLAEAPPGLRASILNATIYAPPAAQLPLGLWELAALGAALATAVWLAILFVTDHAFAASVTANVTALLEAILAPSILTWCGAGTCVAIVVSLLGSEPSQLPLRRRG